MGIPTKWCSTIIFITGSFLHISIFFILPYVSLSHSFHFLPKNTRWEWVWKGKHSVFIVFFQLAAAHFDFWWAQGISNTPRLISPLGKSHGMVFNPAFSCSDFPNLSYFPGHYFSHIPFISLQRTLFWEAFGFDRFFIFSNFWASWMVLAAAHFDFWGAQGISNTPKIISPLGKSHKIVFLSCSDFPRLSYFPSFLPYSLHFPPKNSFFGKRSVLIDCSIVSASWMVLAAAHFEFWEVQGISNTPRIISPLGKSHKMVFNLALCYSGFSSLSCFSLFLPYSLHFPSKNVFLGSVRFW